MCPACISPGIGPGYWAAFAICGLFFVVALGVLFWASRSGRLDGLESSKFKMLTDEE